MSNLFDLFSSFEQLRPRFDFAAAFRDIWYRLVGTRIRQAKVTSEKRAEVDLEEYLRSHVCLKPFRNIETTNRGLAHVCCPDWLPTPIGGLGSDLVRAWSGKTARKIRDSIIDGSYRYCSRVHCSEIANRTLEDRNSEEVCGVIREFSEPDGQVPPPKYIGLSHDRSCNLSCPSCRKEPIVAGKQEQAKFDDLFDRVLVPVLRMAEEVYVTGSGDPFGSNHFRRVLKRLSDDDLSHLTIDLHTNGQLFDERAWNDLGLSGRVGYVHISIDAAQPATYSVVRRGGSFERLRKNLAFVRELRRKGQIRFLEFSMVVQTRNFREMPVFARLGQEFSADAVSFQMIRNWGTFSDAEFKEEFIGDRSHPRHRELIDVLSSPDLTLPIVRIGNVVGYAAESVQ